MTRIKFVILFTFFSLVSCGFDTPLLEGVPGSHPSDSLRNATKITIQVLDDNNWSPEFITPNDNHLVEVFETVPQVDVSFSDTIAVFDQDDPDQPQGQFDVLLIRAVKLVEDGEELVDYFQRGDVLRDGSRKGEKLVEILPTVSFEGKWGIYRLDFEAKDHGVNPTTNTTEASYTIKIINENLHPPIFIYPKSDCPKRSTREVISLDQTVGRLLKWDGTPLPPAEAIDDDDPGTGNGRFGFTLLEDPEDPDDGFQYFSVNEETGELRLRLEFDNANAKFYNMHLKVEDKPDDEELAKDSTVKMVLFLLPGTDRPPYFPDGNFYNVTTIRENSLEDFEELPKAIDPDAEIPLDPEMPPLKTEVFYYIEDGIGDDFFEIFAEGEGEAKVHKLRAKVKLDYETAEIHKVRIRASNCAPADPDCNQQLDEKSYLNVEVQVVDVIDNPPTFKLPHDSELFSGGFSPVNYPGEVLLKVEYEDLDKEDQVDGAVTVAISSDFVRSDTSLPEGNVFEFKAPTNMSADILIHFAPQTTMRGHYTFSITATDSGGLSSTVQAKMYMVREDNVVEFRFFNRFDFMEGRRANLSLVLSAAFGFRCNIDRISPTEDFPDVDASRVLTHFIDLGNNEPVHKGVIEEQQYDSALLERLKEQLSSIGLTLAPDGIGSQPEEDEESTTFTTGTGTTFRLLPLLPLLFYIISL